MKLKKLLLTIIIITITLNVVLINNVSRATYNLTNANLYSKEEYINLLRYNGIKIGTYYVVYNKDGIEYPAYCLERTKSGVGEGGDTYTVDATELVTNVLVWKAATNGYPYKTPQELGCQSVAEAYIATKLAIYDVMHNYDYNKFVAVNESGARILAAIKSISATARNSRATKISSNITIVPQDTEWKVEEKDSRYIYKIYSVSTEGTASNYKVSLDGTVPEDTAILDLENNVKTEFEADKKFKIRIPLVNLIKDGEFNINVDGAVKTKPIFYGKSPNTAKQSYALTGAEFEDGSGTIKQKYIKNNTKIEILKLDGENGEMLQEAEFQLLDENKNILYVDLKTNEQGKILMNNLMPGKYFLKETKTKLGYVLYNELIEIQLALNEELTVKVNNFKENDTKIEVIKNTIEVSNKTSNIEVSNSEKNTEINNSEKKVEIDNNKENIKVNNGEETIEIDNNKENLEINNKKGTTQINNNTKTTIVKLPKTGF